MQINIFIKWKTNQKEYARNIRNNEELKCLINAISEQQGEVIDIVYSIEA